MQQRRLVYHGGLRDGAQWDLHVPAREQWLPPGDSPPPALVHQ